MKKRITTIFIAILTVIVSVVILTGCPARDRVPSGGFKVGFSYERSGGPIIAAVQGRTTPYEIDDVRLSCYYGGRTTKYVEGNMDRETGEYQYRYEDVSVSLYWVTQRNDEVAHADYKNIEGYYFIKEIPIEEFNEGPHDISIKWSKKLNFHYRETLTVPSEVFTKERGHLGFTVIQVAYDRLEKGYRLMSYGGGGVNVYYVIQEDGSVLLSGA